MQAWHCVEFDKYVYVHTSNLVIVIDIEIIGVNHTWFVRVQFYKKLGWFTISTHFSFVKYRIYTLFFGVYVLWKITNIYVVMSNCWCGPVYWRKDTMYEPVLFDHRPLTSVCSYAMASTWWRVTFLKATHGLLKSGLLFSSHADLCRGITCFILQLIYYKVWRRINCGIGPIVQRKS